MVHFGICAQEGCVAQIAAAGDNFHRPGAHWSQGQAGMGCSPPAAALVSTVFVFLN